MCVKIQGFINCCIFAATSILRFKWLSLYTSGQQNNIIIYLKTSLHAWTAEIKMTKVRFHVICFIPTKNRHETFRPCFSAAWWCVVKAFRGIFLKTSPCWLEKMLMCVRKTAKLWSVKPLQCNVKYYNALWSWKFADVRHKIIMGSLAHYFIW